MYVGLRNFLRFCHSAGAFLALSIAAPSAFAAVSNVGPSAVRSGASSFTVSAASNGTPIAVASRSVVAGATSGEFLIRDMFVATGPAGSLPLQATRTVSGLGVARAIATQAAKGFTPVAIGLGAYDLMQAYRMRSSASGGLEVDPGVNPSPKDTWKTSANCNGKYTSSGYVPNIGQGGSGSTAIASCQSQKATSEYIPMGCASGYLYPNGTQYSMTCTYRTAVAPNGYIATESISAYKSSVMGCEEQLDALTGQSYLPGVGGDGKCLTGRYEPITDTAAASKLAAAMTIAAVKDYINSPASPASPVQEVAPMSVTGPATQVGLPVTTTTTSPTGSVTNTVTSTYQYNYAGDTITYNTVNQTVTNNTTTGGTTTTTTETKPQTDIPGLCDLFPDISACRKLDIPDTSGDALPSEDWSPSITPHVFSSSATCPAPLSVSFPRISFVVQWTPLCDLARDFLAPIVAVLSVFSAARVFFGGFRV